MTRNNTIELNQKEDGSYGTGGQHEAGNWAVLCHLSALLGYIMPFGHVVGPLAVWLWKRKTSAFVEDQGKQALNFQMSMSVYFLLSWALTVVMIGVPMLIFFSVFDLVMIVVAGWKCREGKPFRYPLSIQFLK